VGQDPSGAKGIRVIEHDHAFTHATVDPEQALEIAATLMTAATSNIHISPPGKSVGAGGTMLTVLALRQAWRRGRHR
jgi:hypothetical protein